MTRVRMMLSALVVVVATLLVAAAPAAALPDFGTSPVQDLSHDGVVKVTRIEAAQHDGFDRTTFYFEGAGDPGHWVEYTEGFWDAKDQPVIVDGSHFIAVRIWGTGWVDGISTRDTVTPRLPALRQIKFVTEFEGEAVYGVGLSNGNGFRVFELTDPQRLVVDVKH